MNDLENHYESKHSQNNEDSILLRILDLIPVNKTYWEFGVEDGKECNTRILRDTWEGTILDGGYENKSINLDKEIVTYINIWDLITEYKIPSNLGVLSIDTDYNDAYLACRLLQKVKPSIIIAEYNAGLGMADKTVIHDHLNFWDRSTYYGCSAACLIKIYSNYSLVYMNNVNMFFVKKPLLKNTDFKQKPLREWIAPFINKKQAFLKYDYLKRNWVTSKQVNGTFVQKTIRYSNKALEILKTIDLSRLKHASNTKNYRMADTEISRINALVFSRMNAPLEDKKIINTLICNKFKLLL